MEIHLAMIGRWGRYVHGNAERFGAPNGRFFAEFEHELLELLETQRTDRTRVIFNAVNLLFDPNFTKNASYARMFVFEVH